MKHASLCLLLLLTAFLAGPLWARSSADPQGPARLYSEGARILGGNEGVVARRLGPVRLVVVREANGEGATKGIGEDSAAAAHEIAAETAAMAGLPFAPVQNSPTRLDDWLASLSGTSPGTLSPPCEAVPGLRGEPVGGPCANLVVVIASNAAMRRVADAIPLRAVFRDALAHDPELYCFFVPYENRRRVIESALIYVRSGLSAAMMRTCLTEEIVQSFGLYGDVPGSELFSFNDVVAPKSLTECDRALFLALYDERVRPGYPAGLVMQIFVNSLRPDESGRPC